MAAAAIFNHATTTAQALAARPAAAAGNSTTGTDSTSNSSDGDGGSATISANDFLTLLVTEMQNQDPTADTDPNEYINQLVEVNSLEQLININQTLTTDLGGASSTTGTGASGQIAAGPSGTAGAAVSSSSISQQVLNRAGRALPMQPSLAAVGVGTDGQAQAAERSLGNLSIPPAMPAAQRVASALDGRQGARPAANVFSPAR